MMKSLKNSKSNVLDQLNFFDVSKKFQSYVTAVKNPIYQYDEYEIFSDMIGKFRKNNNDIYVEWEKNLTGDYQSYWNELMKTRRINISYDEQTSFNVPRRIVKVKRSNESSS